MINNGGGLFTPDGKLDVLNERNVEAIDFVHGAGEGRQAVDPASVSYTTDNHLAQWKNKKFAFGIYTAGLDQTLGEPSRGDLLVASPLTGPHGDKASLAFGNNIMMYTNTPSQPGSEAFLTYYIKNMKTYWQQGVVTGTARAAVHRRPAGVPEEHAEGQGRSRSTSRSPRPTRTRSHELFAAMARWTAASRWPSSPRPSSAGRPTRSRP